MEEKVKVKVLTEAFMLSDGQIIDAKSLEKFAALPDGLQRKSEDVLTDEFDYKGGELVEPPYPLSYLAALMLKNTPHYRCIKAKSNDITGLNYRIVEVEKEGDDTKGDKENCKIVEEFFRNCSDDVPFITVTNRMIIDFLSLGMGYFEVTRDIKGKVAKVYHVPGSSIRVRSDLKGYAQQIGQRKIYFVNWGEKYKRTDSGFEPKELISSEDGKVLTSGEVLKSANEIIPFSNYHPGSSHYGVPDIIPAVSAIAGNICAASYNIDFFEHHAVPRYAIIIKGATLTPALEADIKQFFKTEIKGKPHRSIIMPVPFDDVTVEFKALDVQVNDQSFTIYRRDNRDEILMAHGVHPARIGLIETGQLGSGSGLSQQENYKNSIVEPIQNWIEHIITHCIIREGLGIEDWQFKFSDLDIRDKTQEVNNGLTSLQRGCISINEFRTEILGKPEVPGGSNYVIWGGQGGLTLVKDLGDLPNPNQGMGMPALPEEKSLNDLRDSQAALSTTLTEVEQIVAKLKASQANSEQTVANLKASQANSEQIVAGLKSNHANPVLGN